MDETFVDDAEFAAAEARGRTEQATTPRAASARYDRDADRIVIELVNGSAFSFPPRIAQDLRDASPDQLAAIEVSPAGFGLFWPRLDVDFSVAGLMAGRFGTAAFLSAQNRDRSPSPDDAGADGRHPRPREAAS